MEQGLHGAFPTAHHGGRVADGQLLQHAQHHGVALARRKLREPASNAAPAVVLECLLYRIPACLQRRFRIEARAAAAIAPSLLGADVAQSADDPGQRPAAEAKGGESREATRERLLHRIAGVLRRVGPEQREAAQAELVAAHELLRRDHVSTLDPSHELDVVRFLHTPSVPCPSLSVPAA